MFAIFFQTDGNFYQIILSCTQGRSPNKSLVKKKMSSEIKLLTGTKVYDCINSKGDNFNVNQLPKTNYMSETKRLAVFLIGNRWLLK